MIAKDIIRNGLYEMAVSFMDDSIRERLHEELSPCTDQEFLEAYMAEHEKKYGKPFEI